MWNPREVWWDCRVTDVTTIEEFVRRYYKPDRIFTSDFPNYFELLCQSRREDIERSGVCIISHHDSVTGRVVAFYGKEA